MSPIAEPALPRIIQGGMGVAVSGWQLARAVAARGQLGVVSGTGLDQVLTRRLQLGDTEGHLRRAMAHFPHQDVVRRVMASYFIEGGKSPEAPYRTPPMFGVNPPRDLAALVALANFVEVWLAREGHTGPVGINLLDKIQLPNLASLYGAMLAGVDYVLMGAGIPWQVPSALDRMAAGDEASMRVVLEDDPEGLGDEIHFDPVDVFGAPAPVLPRPRFLAIIAAAPVAQALLKRAGGRVDGFVVEGPTAGGHNAPPRGPLRLSQSGEPVYGERDIPDLDRIRALGLPFWLAGGMGRPGRLAAALAQGAAGIQVGTAFALCRESGILPEYRREILNRLAAGEEPVVFTDPLASPTGFPFKVVDLAGSVAEPEVYAARERVCDAGYLRRAYRRPDGTIGYRCPGEPVDRYTAKGGDAAEAEGRMCLCNGLLATIGLGQRRDGGRYEEPPLMTAGDDLATVGEFLPAGAADYGADDVLDRLMAGVSD
jgi:nitronate monooxygenase